MAKGLSSASRRKRVRLYFIIGALGFLGLAAALTLSALDENIVFFVSPKDVEARGFGDGQRFRLGGLVAGGSVVYSDDGLDLNFTVTDFEKTVDVTYHGLVPDLFAENQGVIAEGRFDASGTFIADTVLAKHDENYMPPEVAQALEEALEKTGHPDADTGESDTGKSDAGESDNSGGGR